MRDFERRYAVVKWSKDGKDVWFRLLLENQSGLVIVRINDDKTIYGVKEDSDPANIIFKYFPEIKNREELSSDGWKEYKRRRKYEKIEIG